MPHELPYSKGDRIQVDGEVGVVNFIGTHYLTLTTHEWANKETLHGVSQVNVLIYRHLWPTIQLVKSNVESDSNEHHIDSSM